MVGYAVGRLSLDYPLELDQPVVVTVPRVDAPCPCMSLHTCDWVVLSSFLADCNGNCPDRAFLVA